jgi:molybdopterin converting factor small subunit
MNVHIKVLGALMKPFGKDELDFEIAERTTLEELLLKLGYQQGHLRFIVASVGGAQQRLGYLLKDGDELTLVLPTSGG